ncbi:MAG: 50S ribosomal protein L36, partial [Thermomicrobiales bacterium]
MRAACAIPVRQPPTNNCGLGDGSLGERKETAMKVSASVTRRCERCKVIRR